MAGYRVESTVLSARCTRGREHLERASIRNGYMANEEKTGAELRDMRRNGDSFVLVVGGMNELSWPSVSFDECVCGSGVVMTQGKSAYQLTKEARDKGSV